jgi:antitoxin YefM
MNIYTTSQVGANLFQIIDDTAQSHDPTYILGRKHKMVLLAEEDYRALLETLHITSVPGMTKSILDASQEPLENFSDKIDWDEL